VVDYTIKGHIFGHFSPLLKAMWKLKDIRDHAYGHTDKTVIENHIYDGYKKDIEENVMVLAKICRKEYETRLALDDVQKQVLVCVVNLYQHSFYRMTS
jgi:hypothetical protein